jgi:hypothetical protein
METALAATETANGKGQAATAWRYFLLTFTLTSMIIGCALAALIVIIDPYQTARPGWVATTSGLKMNPRLGAAGRSIDPTFTAMLLGNSHSESLNPSRLNSASGLTFASLSMPGTASLEQLAVIDWIARRRTTPLSALVVIIDTWWCAADGPYQTNHPFPHWLYADNWATYGLGLLRWESLELTFTKLGLLMGRTNPTRADGFNDVEAELTYDPSAALRRLQAPLGLDRLGSQAPAAIALQNVASRLPAQTRLILLMTPVYAPSLPAAQSPGAELLDSCKSAFARVAANRPGDRWIDLMDDTPLTNDPLMFWDTTHFRGQLTQQVEAAIATALVESADKQRDQK